MNCNGGYGNDNIRQRLLASVLASIQHDRYTLNREEVPKSIEKHKSFNRQESILVALLHRL
jgi:hypothetical protein